MATPRTYIARAIKYERKGFRPQTVLTSLTDSARYPAKEVAALYHERWELELGFDEIKTEMLARQETIRSRTVDGVGQEILGNPARLQSDPARDGANRR